MKISCLTPVLRSAVRKAASATGGSIPIMGNVFVEAKGEELFITGGDGERKIIAARCSCSNGNGAVCLPANRLAAILSEADGESTEIEFAENNKAIITCDNWPTTLAGEDAKEYPALPDLGDAITWTLPAKEFSEKLAQVFSARSPEGLGRTMLETVYVSVENGSVDYVATDGRRVAAITGKITGDNGSVIIPDSACRILMKHATEGSITLRVSRSYLVAELAELTLYFRLFEGKYPNWKILILPTDDGTGVLQKNDFLSAVKKVTAVGEDQHKSKRIKLQIEPDQIIVSINHHHASEYPCRCTASDTAELHFNADLLYPLVQGAPDGELEFEWSDKAILFRSGAWSALCYPMTAAKPIPQAA